MDFVNILNIIIIIIFDAIGVLIFLRMWKNVNIELRTAPRYTKFQRFKNKLSAITYSLMVTFSIIFVIAILSSAIADNAIKAIRAFYDLTETSLLIRILEVFKFPNFIPFTLIFITLFALIYPFYEYLLLAQKGTGGPMEVQQWIETKFIDRFNPPWSYFSAIILFFIIVILTPLITSIIALETWHYPADVSGEWVVRLIFMVWLLLGPIFYLSFYARIGIVQSFFRARRVDLKENKKYAIIYGAVIILFISSVWSFFTYLPILFGNFPEPRLVEYVDTQRGFIKNLITVIEFFNPDIAPRKLEPIIIFFTIFPIDFVWFTITVMGFGIYGFYAKFLSKEPLNSNKMVLFAAYIVCGIAFSIFVNTIIRWPWILPDSSLSRLGLDLNLNNPIDQDFVIRIFSTAIFVERTINLIFIIHFVFRRKDLRLNADEWALHKAIETQDLDTIIKYATHEQAEMRFLVADALVRYIRSEKNPSLSPESSKNIALVMDLLVEDQDETVTRFMEQHQEEIIAKLDQESLIQGLERLVNKDSKEKSKQINEILQLISDDSIEKTLLVIKKLIAQGLPRDILQEIFSYLRFLDSQYHSQILQIIQQYLTPQIAHANPELSKECLKLIKYNQRQYSADFETLAEIFEPLLHHLDTDIIANTLDTYSTIALIKDEYIAKVMHQFNLITQQTPDIIRAKIGSIVKFANKEPKWFPNLFDYIEIYLNQDNSQIKSDATVALGSLTSNISPDIINNQIFPYFKQLVHEEDDDVRKALVSSLVFIAKTKPEIFQQENFQHLFAILMLDENVEIRHKIYRHLIQIDPKLLLTDITAVIETPLRKEIRVDLLNVLASMAEEISPYVEEVNLISKLLKQNFAVDQKLNLELIEELQEDKSKLFGFRSNIEELSVIEATTSLLYEICYYAPQYYDKVKDFLTAQSIKAGDMATAKMIEFHGKISIDILKENRWVPIDIDVISTFNLINEHLFAVGPLTQETIIFFISRIYSIDTSTQAEIIPIIYGLLKQPSEPAIKAQDQLLRLFAQIITDHPNLYFQKITIKNLIHFNEISINPFVDMFQEYLLKKLMPKSHPIIQKGIGAALLVIAKNPDKRHMVEDLLLATIKHKHPNVKIAGMNALISMPIDLENREIISIFKRHLQENNPEVKATAIDCLGKMLRTYPTLTEKNKKREFKTIRSLIYRTFFYTYNKKADIRVKKAIINNIHTIALIQPEIPICIKLLDELTKDPNLEIATQAVSIIFEYVDLYPEKLKEDLMLVFRHLANHPSIKINLMMIDKLEELHDNDVDLNRLIPTILKLTTASNQKTRSKGLNAFNKIYLSDPAQFEYCVKLLLQLIEKSKIEIQRDACELLCYVSETYADQLQENVEIFVIFQKLARDYDYQINLTISKYLKSLLEQYPKRQNDTLQISYILLRKSSRKRRKIVDLSLKALEHFVDIHPKKKSEIKSRLKRFFKKNQDPLIETTLKKIDKK